MSQQVGQFVIKLGADQAEFINNMEQAKKRVRNYGTQAKATADVNNKLSKGFQEAANNTAIFLGPLNSTSGILSSISAGISRVGAAQLAMTTVITGTIFALKNALDTYEQWETAQLSNEQLLKSTGYAAGYNAKQLQELSEEVAMSTLASVDGVQQALGALVTFKRVAEENIKPAIYIAQDMAQVFGQDVKSSATQLGKALEDPIKGITSLKRVGVSFSQTQKDQIENFVKTNQLAKAQAAVLGVLQGQMGGSGQAAAQGLAGSWDTLGQQWDTLMTRLADRSGLADATKNIVNNIGVGVGELASKLAETEAATQYGDLSKQFFDLHFGILTAKGTLEEYNALANQPDKLREKYGDRFNVTVAIAETEKRILSLENQKLSVQQQQVKVANQMKQEREDDANVYQKKQEAQALMEKEAAAERAALAQVELDKKQAAGLRTLNAIEGQLLAEEDQARNSYNKRLEDLASLKLNEEEIAKRGFDNISELRAYYSDLARQEYASELDAIVERDAKELAQEQAKQAALLGARENATETLNELYALQIEQLANHQISEQELQASGFETQAEARLLYEEQLRAGYEERLEFITLHNEKEVNAETKKWQDLAKMQKQNAKQRETMEQGVATKSLGIIASSTKEGSGLWAAAILAQQGMLASQAVMQANILATQTTAAQMPAPGTDVTGALTAKAIAAGETVRGWGMLNAALIMAQGVSQVAGAREFGGPVLGGYNYLVGENGPEVVSFGSSGTVHPNRSIGNFSGDGGNNITLNQTIDARGADTGAEDRILAASNQLIDAAYQKVLTDVKNSGPIRRELGS